MLRMAVTVEMTAIFYGCSIWNGVLGERASRSLVQISLGGTRFSLQFTALL